MLYGKFNNIPLPILLYAVILISSSLFWLTNRLIYSIKPNFVNLVSFRSNLIFSALSVFTFLLIVQTISITKVWINNFERYSKTSEIDKFHDTNLEQSLKMAGFCNGIVSGSHKAIFETDLDINNDPGMIIHRSLAYYLYPIDIRGIHRGEPDLWIAFNKNEAIKHIPDGYKVLGILNNQNIIAIKE